VVVDNVGVDGSHGWVGRERRPTAGRAPTGPRVGAAVFGGRFRVIV
jgi:hypothetical protein